jgi:predicted metal-binding membrane protein
MTPLKSVCLRHCRSPLGFFLRFGGRIRRPAGALRMGAAHGAFCFGCCWALFAVLVALGTMNLLWMVLFTALIVLEKHAPRGEQIAVAGALALAAVGAALLTDPSMLAHLT